MQTVIDIYLKVCNAIQLVKKCPPTINKKHLQLCTKGRSPCFILTSNVQITEHSNDMPNKRVGQASKLTFSREYKVDKYKLQNENIQLQRTTKLPICK
jgi:hypothetical protein